jgi:hypothetical protein
MTATLKNALVGRWKSWHIQQDLEPAIYVFLLILTEHKTISF